MPPFWTRFYQPTENETASETPSFGYSTSPIREDVITTWREVSEHPTFQEWLNLGTVKDLETFTVPFDKSNEKSGKSDTERESKLFDEMINSSQDAPANFVEGDANGLVNK